MDLAAQHVYDVLSEKKVTTINHANSVVTACEFLRRGALLSRGTAERQGLLQSSQDSDEIDKRHSIWFDVFADSVDIHGRASRVNVYGPVLFILDAAIVTKAYTGRIWVTKLNPTKWGGVPPKDRWFQNKADLKNLVKGRFDQMVVFRHCGGELPLASFLKGILLDDPGITTKDDLNLYSVAWGALTLAASQGGVSVKISKRKCVVGCGCVAGYKKDVKNTIKLFVPRL